MPEKERIEEQRALIEPQKHFATMVIGVALVAIGAMMINQGMNAVQDRKSVV